MNDIALNDYIIFFKCKIVMGDMNKNKYYINIQVCILHFLSEQSAGPGHLS